MIDKEKALKRIQLIKDQLDLAGLEYTVMGECNPVFIEIKLGSKNKDNISVTNTDGIKFSISLYNFVMQFYARNIYDPKGRKLLKIYERMNKLNREETQREKFFIDEDGKICMKFTRDVHSAVFITNTIFEYKKIFIESDFIKDTFIDDIN